MSGDYPESDKYLRDDGSDDNSGGWWRRSVKIKIIIKLCVLDSLRDRAKT